MDGVGAGDLGRGDDAGDVEVRFARGRGADAHVIVGEPDVQRFAIGFGVDCHRLDGEFAAGADHTKGDLAPISYKDLLKHFRPLKKDKRTGASGQRCSCKL